jgi:hypothetical protein
MGGGGGGGNPAADTGSPVSRATNPLLEKSSAMKNSAVSKRGNKKAARMAASDFDNDDLL